MTLRKCSFGLRIILNGLSKRGTTEIINKPLNHYFRGFYISTRMNARAFFQAPFRKSVLHRVAVKLRRNRSLTLAGEIN